MCDVYVYCISCAMCIVYTCVYTVTRALSLACRVSSVAVPVAVLRRSASGPARVRQCRAGAGGLLKCRAQIVTTLRLGLRYHGRVTLHSRLAALGVPCLRFVLGQKPQPTPPTSVPLASPSRRMLTHTSFHVSHTTCFYIRDRYTAISHTGRTSTPHPASQLPHSSQADTHACLRACMNPRPYLRLQIRALPLRL